MRIKVKNTQEMVYAVAIVMALAAVVSLAVGWVFMALWNWLVPDLFHGPRLSYWQAFGLMFLLHMLTSGIRTRND